MTKLNSFHFSFVKRIAPSFGPTSSDDWNDTVAELSNDLSSITNEWNNKLITITNSLPDGTVSSSIDAFTYGLDGKNIWVDGTLTGTSIDKTFFNGTRPYTLEEALRNLYSYVDTQNQSVIDNVQNISSGLTAAQKASIGARIFDSTKTSTSTSLDGKSENNRLNINQIYSDTYGTGYTLGNNGLGRLVNSVKDMVGALLTLHGGAWDNNISVNHTAITASENTIPAVSQNDSFVGTPAYLYEDLDQLRTTLKTTKGTAVWTTNLPVLYTGGADSLYDLLSTTKGSSTKTATNPWGYNYTDIDNLVGIISAGNTFCGQSSAIDTIPDYSSTTYVQDGQSLTTAIGRLDYAETIQSGLVSYEITQRHRIDSYVGRGSDSLSIPTWPGGTTYLKTGNSLYEAITEVDHGVVLLSGLTQNSLRLDGTNSPTATINMGSQDIKEVHNLYCQSGITSSGYIACHGNLIVYPTGPGNDDSLISTQNLLLLSLDGGRLDMSDSSGRIWHITVTTSGTLSIV